ncbi:MAG TPA: hypothetical protein VEV13_07340 [Candidatus Limnocylindria bacterium]|nr:hypothetical protein [Candidatus Limnocylindria bacterium]
MRVYLPATFSALQVLLDSGSLDADVALAVTDELRDALPAADEEELELEAMLDAAERSLALVAADPSAVRRRLVLAADVPVVRPAPELGPAAVRLDGVVPLSAVVSGHVDEEGVEAQVDAGEVEDLALLWYAVQELGGLVGR